MFELALWPVNNCTSLSREFNGVFNWLTAWQRIIGGALAMIQPGTAVLIVLHTPREKCWGILAEINSAGVFLRGLDLNSFDDWLHATMHGEEFIGLGDLFFPMWRVERMSTDESSAGIFSLKEQVETRTGRKLEELLG